MEDGGSTLVAADIYSGGDGVEGGSSNAVSISVESQKHS